MAEIYNYFDENVIAKITKILANGGVVIFPTETVYALAADASNDEAIKKIQRLKSRSVNKPLSLFVFDLHQARSVVDLNENALKLATRFFPGPLTLVLKRSENSLLSEYVNPLEDTIGVRIPDHLLSLKILKAFGRPIIATSANISGRNDDAKDITKIIEDFQEVDLIIDGGLTEHGNFSTVVDLCADQPKILRSGVISDESILKTLGYFFEKSIL
jgi:L-threonylcarbamoyladenylate synthase